MLFCYNCSLTKISISEKSEVSKWILPTVIMSRGRSYNSFYCFPFSVLQVCLKARVVKKLTCFRTVCGFFVKKDLWSISPHTISTERRVVIISTSIKKLGTSLIKSGAFIDVLIVTWLFIISNVHFHYTKLKVTSFSNDVKKKSWNYWRGPNYFAKISLLLS